MNFLIICSFILINLQLIQCHEFHAEFNLINSTTQNIQNHDQFKCNITSKVQQDQSFIVEKTNRSNLFDFHELQPENGKCFTFSVRASNEIAVSLTNFQKLEMFELFIGLGGDPINQESKIRRLAESKMNRDSELYLTPSIISDTYFHGFWVSWIDNQIVFGREGDIQPIMIWNETSMFDITLIGIRTSRSSGEWILTNSTCPTVKNSKIYQTMKCQQQETSQTEQKPSVEILYQINLLEQINLDFEMFEMMRNRSHNVKFLEKCQQELDENFNKSKELHAKILLNSDTIDGNDLKKYLETTIYSQIRTKFFEYYHALNEELNKSSMTSLKNCDTSTELSGNSQYDTTGRITYSNF